MKTILKEISTLAVRLDELIYNDEQKNSEWLGNEPALLEEIKLTESQLGVQFPEDYKNFLLTTNGFFTPCHSTEPSFAPIDKIDYLINVDDFVVKIWCEGVLAETGKELSRSIIVGGINEEQYFLLIPPGRDSEDWKYWKFAHWIPGEEPYENLEVYFDSVLEFLREQS